jgi:hypothetical protein
MGEWARGGRAKTSALLVAGPFRSASPCAGFEPFVAVSPIRSFRTVNDAKRSALGDMTMPPRFSHAHSSLRAHYPLGQII